MEKTINTFTIEVGEKLITSPLREANSGKTMRMRYVQFRKRMKPLQTQNENAYRQFIE